MSVILYFVGHEWIGKECKRITHITLCLKWNIIYFYLHQQLGEHLQDVVVPPPPPPEPKYANNGFLKKWQSRGGRSGKDNNVSANVKIGNAKTSITPSVDDTTTCGASPSLGILSTQVH